MLQNAYFLAKIGADTAENEQHFAEILPKIGNYPTGRAGSLEHAVPGRLALAHLLAEARVPGERAGRGHPPPAELTSAAPALPAQINLFVIV